jgi:Leucine-rich repeat (LRR) protein
MGGLSMVSRRSFLGLLGAPALSWADDDAWIAKLGGKVRRDGSGNIVEINLRGRWVSTSNILDLLGYKKLSRLDLGHTRILDSDLLYLRPATQIEDLNIAYSEHITDVGMSAIRDWRRLKRLDVSGTQVADATLTLLGRMTALESLDVAASEVTDDGIPELLPLTNLKHLGLGRSELGEAAAEALGLLDNLQSLDLSGPRERRNRRGNAGEPIRQTVVEAVGRLLDLRILRVGHSGADAASLQSWTESMKKLERLGLENCNRIDDSAIPVIEGWRSLKQVDLQATRVTAERIVQLRRSRPDLKVLSSPPAESSSGG